MISKKLIASCILAAITSHDDTSHLTHKAPLGSRFIWSLPLRPQAPSRRPSRQLISGLQSEERAGERAGAGGNFQTLLGVTGSGKTYTVANVIEKLQRPTLVIAHNKTLAAQLYNEFKEFFPENRVEYFVSYYDYYQPESYIPAKDQYIEKDSHINPKIEQMRLAATASLLSRSDVIVVASVSCIYGLGNPENFQKMGFEVMVGERISRREILGKLVDILFERNDLDLSPGRFRSKGDTIDLVPGYFNNIIRIELFGDEIERISEVDRQTGLLIEDMNYFFIYPARHYVIPEEEQKAAIETILAEMEERLPQLGMIEAHRLRQRTLHDMEMISETGSCKGIENYSRHFDRRQPGEAPYCLIDYFPDDFLLVIDESHQTLPQLRAMYNGDRSRKKSLVDYGFRLPSSYDNRPLRFEEFEQHMKNVIFVSATPGDLRAGAFSPGGGADHPAHRPARSSGGDPAHRWPGKRCDDRDPPRGGEGRPGAGDHPHQAPGRGADRLFGSK